MRKMCAAVLLSVLWYFEAYGTGQVYDILGQAMPGVVGVVLPATLGPYADREECERYRVFYQKGDEHYQGRVGVLQCRAIVTD